MNKLIETNKISIRVTTQDLTGQTVIVSRESLKAGTRNGDRRLLCIEGDGCLPKAWDRQAIFGTFRGLRTRFERRHISGLALHALAPDPAQQRQIQQAVHQRNTLPRLDPLAARLARAEFVQLKATRKAMRKPQADA